MKKLKMNLELSGLDHKTHIWFPLPKRTNGEPEEWLNPQNFKIVSDKKFGNKPAYFSTSFPEFKISAVFPLSNNSYNTDNPKIFLQPNSLVQSDHPAIKNIANSLIAGAVGDNEKAKRCFDWTVDYLEYANPIRGLYSSVQALTDRKVDCGGFSTLLTALLRASKVPARCVFGWAIESKFGYHAWVEFFDNKKSFWIACDPSVVHLGNRTKLEAGFGFINDERIILSVGEDIKLKGNDGFVWSTPLLQSPVAVTLCQNYTPQSFNYDLTWKVIK